MEKLGLGPYLLIANHNVGAPFEVLALLDAWQDRFAGQRPVYGLAHSFVFRLPGLGTLMSRAGGLPATRENACRRLQAGHSVAIFPGGTSESIRPFTQRHRSDLRGHQGWARIALAEDVPVVPISIVGGHSVNPVLFRARFLATMLVLPRLLGIRWYAITLSQIIYSGIAWALLSKAAPVPVTALVCYLVFVMTIQCPVWPARIRILVGDPLDLRSLVGGIADEGQKLGRCYEEVQGRIQSGMDRLNAS